MCLVIWSHKHWHRERRCTRSSAAAHVAVRCVLLQPVLLLLEHAGGVYAISKVSSGAIFSCSNDFTVRQVRNHSHAAAAAAAAGVLHVRAAVYNSMR